jgi:two-component system, NarL family, nitrate/nitrite sensor histidine kinase NarX
MDAFEPAEEPEEGRYKLPALLALSEIASSLSTDADVEALLARYLGTLVRIAGASAGAVRLLTEDGAHLRLVAALGLPDDVLRAERIVRLDCGPCGEAVRRDSELCSRELERCVELTASPFFGRCAEVCAIPLRHGGRALGVFNLFLASPANLPADVRALFRAIGEHLGMALENARLTRENTRAVLVAERQMLASQVHDSVTQTLAYARMRAGALRRAQAEGDAALAARYQAELEQALELAYSELRALIGQFRQPMDPRGVTAALRGALEAFRGRTGIQASFENRLQDAQLAPEQELQVFHIVQEALSNIERHASARSVRIVFEPSGGERRIRIEDDGIGFDPERAARPGHFGLSIMRERAARLSGALVVDAAPGAGARLLLVIPERP